MLPDNEQRFHVRFPLDVDDHPTLNAIEQCASQRHKDIEDFRAKLKALRVLDPFTVHAEKPSEEMRRAGHWYEVRLQKDA